MSKLLFNRRSVALAEWTLNAPKVLNSVDIDMIDLMLSELVKWRQEGPPRALVMNGAGGKAFCAGADIVSLYNSRMTDGADKTILSSFFAKKFLLDYTLSQMTETRQISVWNGVCMGGGVGLSWHSPVRIATDNSLFAMPVTVIGSFLGVGGSYFLPRVANENASLGLYLGLTGARVKGKDLVKYGLATHYVHSDSLSDFYELLELVISPDSSDS